MLRVTGKSAAMREAQEGWIVQNRPDAFSAKPLRNL